MNRKIRPVERPFDLRLRLPGSKSIALRHLLISALAKSPTLLTSVPRCDDVDAMFGALAGLGVELERDGKRATVTPPASPFDADADIFFDMSGVTMRFLIAHAALRQNTTWFTGKGKINERPNADLLEALAELGCTTEAVEGSFLPVSVRGPAELGSSATVKTGTSSQYLSALLLIAPVTPNGLTLRLVGEKNSASYVRVTAKEMAKRGVTVETPDDDTAHVAPAEYTGGEFDIEGDASAATYFAALATLHGSSVTLENLGESTIQGDYRFIALCERMGARVERSEASVRIEGPDELQSIGEVDMSNMPDAAQTLFAMAPFLPTATHITGLKTLPLKECDRLECPATELRKCGVDVETTKESMTIEPARELRPAVFDTYEDHRMAMSLSVLASKVPGCEIADPECVSKTYADYWDDFELIYGA